MAKAHIDLHRLQRAFALQLGQARLRHAYERIGERVQRKMAKRRSQGAMAGLKAHMEEGKQEAQRQAQAIAFLLRGKRRLGVGTMKKYAWDKARRQETERRAAVWKMASHHAL